MKKMDTSKIKEEPILNDENETSVFEVKKEITDESVESNSAARMVENSEDNFESTSSFDFKKETNDSIEQSKRKRKKGKGKDKDICGICKKRLSSKHLKRHISSVHEGKKPFKCSNCNFCSAFSRDLNTHISSVHEKKKTLPVFHLQ